MPNFSKMVQDSVWVLGRPRGTNQGASGIGLQCFCLWVVKITDSRGRQPRAQIQLKNQPAVQPEANASISLNPCFLSGNVAQL